MLEGWPLPGRIASSRPCASDRRFVPLQSALGRVLAADIVAMRDQPPAAVSAMDGYAVRAADTTSDNWLEVVGEVAAGQAVGVGVGPGQAARIFTGGLLPPGADAILIQEDAVTGRPCAGEGSRLTRPLCAQASAGLRGGLGQPACRPAARSWHIGLAASLGAAWLEVRRKPRVGLLATGNELVLPGSSPALHQISSSNSFTLGAMVDAWGGLPVDLGIAADEPAALSARLAAAAGLDLLLTTGGASVGEHDLVRRVAGRAWARAGFLEDPDAAGQAPDLRADRQGAAPWSAGQPGVGRGMRHRLPARCTSLAFSASIRSCRAAKAGSPSRCPAGASARNTCAPRGTGGPSLTVEGPGQLDVRRLTTADVLLVRPPRDGHWSRVLPSRSSISPPCSARLSVATDRQGA
ncbi:MAG: molybdopterin-binding protein [Geminicoccaceae bacterium]